MKQDLTNFGCSFEIQQECSMEMLKISFANVVKERDGNSYYDNEFLKGDKLQKF